jgi:hypothetical protein
VIESVIALKNVVVRDRECNIKLPEMWQFVKENVIAHGAMVVRDRECGSSRGKVSS